MSAKITILGLKNYLAYYKRDLFEGLELPEGVDRDTLIDNIVLKSTEFEVLIPDPEVMVKAISVWSKKWFKSFERWVTALNTEYNPLENYDRYEEWTENATSEARSEESTVTSSDGRNDGSVSAFDSAGYTPKDRNVSETHSDGNTQNVAEGKNNNKHIGHLHGNIGVTSSQEMLRQELDIAYWNLYEHITDVFLQEFVIPIY